MDFLLSSPTVVWALVIVAIGLACIVAVAGVIHLWLRRLNSHLQESVQAALDRQRANQERLAEGLNKLDADLAQLRRRLRALESRGSTDSDPGGELADDSPDAEDESGSGKRRKSRRFLH